MCDRGNVCGTRVFVARGSMCGSGHEWGSMCGGGGGEHGRGVLNEGGHVWQERWPL